MSKIELFENERAKDYNDFVIDWIPNYNVFLDLLPKLFSGTKNRNLLAVGCGTGNEIERFATPTQKWKITGVDPSPEMIKQAVEKFKNYSCIDLILGVVSELDTDIKYDAATLLLVLHFIEDNGEKLQLLKDIANRLNKGATFIVLDITGCKKQIVDNLQILKLLLPAEIDIDVINSRLNRIENELCTISESRLAELYEEAGFNPPIRFFQSTIYMGWLTNRR